MEESTLAGEVMQPFENLAGTGLPTKAVDWQGSAIIYWCPVKKYWEIEGY